MTEVASPAARLDAATAIALVRGTMRIRAIEETIAHHYRDQEMRTPTHLSIGQEGVAVGVIAALEPSDAVYSGHRCHAHYLAKGGDAKALIAELYGRETGTTRGRGGSVHLCAPEVGFIAASAILGQTMATAAGTAWAYRMDGLRQVACSFFGDGVVEEGIWHETLNFAVVKGVPALFVCENNGYSTHTPLSVRQPGGIGIAERATGYGLPALRVNGNDVFEVFAAAKEAAAWCRSGRGPYFLECTTYRWREHVGPNWDYDAGYRSKTEVDEWIARCPVRAGQDYLVRQGISNQREIDAWQQEFVAEAEAAVTFAKESPFPALSALFDNTY